MKVLDWIKRRMPGTSVKRSYKGAATNRLTSSWKASNKSADLEAIADADTMRARARDLVRNNAYARGMVDARVRNIVGTGFRPQARVTLANGEPDQLVNDWLERNFRLWSESCDVTGRLDFVSLQQLICSECDVAGEVLLRWVRTRPNYQNPIGLEVELIEADRLASDMYYPRGVNVQTGNIVKRGVEVDMSGRATAYHVYKYHPADVYTVQWMPERLPAEQLQHIFWQDRVQQTRGITRFAPVLQWIKDFGHYFENELISSGLAACFSVAVKSMGGPADGGLYGDESAGTTDERGNTFDHLEPGIVARLFPDEEIQTINPGRSHNEADAWITAILRAMAVGFGLSYERLSRDYSRTNYSSNRASDLEDRRQFRVDRHILKTQLCMPVWRRFVAAMVMRPDSPIDPTEFMMDPARFFASEWHAPGWEWVDPVKEGKAKIDAIAGGLKTVRQTLAEDGIDLDDHLRTKADEIARFESAGVPYPAPESTVSDVNVSDDVEEDPEDEMDEETNVETSQAST